MKLFIVEDLSAYYPQRSYTSSLYGITFTDQKFLFDNMFSSDENRRILINQNLSGVSLNFHETNQLRFFVSKLDSLIRA